MNDRFSPEFPSRIAIATAALIMTLTTTAAAENADSGNAGFEGYWNQRIADAASLPNDRRERLDGAVDAIASYAIDSQAIETHANADRPDRTPTLSFICTHNSRRSQFSQVFATIAAARFGHDHLRCVSGGTEATACNRRVIDSLRRCGLIVELEAFDSRQPTNLETPTNPIYRVSIPQSPSIELLLFSKRYDDAIEPNQDFVAMMCCDDADRACPSIPAAVARVPLHYIDPKISDDSDAEAATYDQRRDQIASEMIYVMSRLVDVRGRETQGGR